MAVRPVTFDSLTAVRDTAHNERVGDFMPAGEAFDAGWSAAMEFALERIQAVQDTLPHCDGPGDVAEEMKALQRRLVRTTGGA